MAFIALCEGYLGIKTHFELWRYFFISLQKNKKRYKSVPMGYMSIHLRGHQSVEYMPCQLSRSNKGWHALWFYVKNTAADPLPEFTGCLIGEALRVWSWGSLEKEK